MPELLDYLSRGLDLAGRVFDFIVTPGFELAFCLFFLVFGLFVSSDLTRINRDKNRRRDPDRPATLQDDNPTPLTLAVRTAGWLVQWVILVVIAGFFLLFLIGLLNSDADFSVIFAGKWKSLYMATIVPVGAAIVAAYTFSWFVLGRRLAVWLNSKEESFRKRHADRKDVLTDVRALHLPEKIDYRPESYFAKAAKDGLMMLGLDEHGKTVTVPRASWVKSHIQVMGAPGKGKGVLAGVVMSQGIAGGDAVAVFDPKNDEWAPSVLAHACRMAGVPFQVVNLNRGMPAQINPLAGASADEACELIEAGLGLGSRGSEGDHYRIGDRKIARMVVREAAATGRLSLPELNAIAQDLPKSLRDEGGDAVALLSELAELTAIQTAQGVTFESLIRQGGCLYIVGNTRDEAVIRLQRLLLLRLVQIRERAPHAHRHLTAFTDEVKYLLSSQLLNALGTIRDKGMNIILSHQSRGDFAQVPGIGEAAARSIVEDTTPIKWLYQTSDYETALWISSKTGLITANTERRSMTRNEGHAERLEGAVELADTQRHLIDTNTIQHLPDGCAVVIGAGIARLAFAAPVRVEKKKFELRPAPPVVLSSAFDNDPLPPDGRDIPPPDYPESYFDEA